MELLTSDYVQNYEMTTFQLLRDSVTTTQELLLLYRAKWSMHTNVWGASADKCCSRAAISMMLGLESFVFLCSVPTHATSSIHLNIDSMKLVCSPLTLSEKKPKGPCIPTELPGPLFLSCPHLRHSSPISAQLPSSQPSVLTHL
jgi:hypothetical protein